MTIARVAPKKISAATFTADSKHVIMADKFGDVYVTIIPEQAEASSTGHLISATLITNAKFRIALMIISEVQEQLYHAIAERTGSILALKCHQISALLAVLLLTLTSSKSLTKGSSTMLVLYR